MRRELHGSAACIPWCSAVVAVVQRPQKVKVRAQNVKGETMMLTLNGWQARIFQHEYDHLQVLEQLQAHAVHPCYEQLFHKSTPTSCCPAFPLADVDIAALPGADNYEDGLLGCISS